MIQSYRLRLHLSNGSYIIVKEDLDDNDPRRDLCDTLNSYAKPGWLILGHVVAHSVAVQAIEIVEKA